MSMPGGVPTIETSLASNSGIANVTPGIDNTRQHDVKALRVFLLDIKRGLHMKLQDLEHLLDVYCNTSVSCEQFVSFRRPGKY